jgi:hypothetical protein
MWKQVKAASTNDTIRKALYVSLFGIKDIQQLKIRIIQSEIPESKLGHYAKELTSTVWNSSKKVLKTVHPGFAALDEVALLAIPGLLRNRMVVIDDIERKHASLGIDEVMGFIDEFTQMYGSRIVLILNSDQLDEKDKGMWDKLREKVIDHEIGLETTPGEAFDIAVGLVPSTHATQIRHAVEICNVSNIRIIQKIIRTVNKLLADRTDLTEEVLQRTVPSTVLMCAVHHHGLEAGPTIEFVMAFNSLHYRMEAEMRRPGSLFQGVPERPPAEKKWAELLDALNINICDDYERMLLAFLTSGLFDGPKVKAILDGYVAETDMMALRERCNHFFELEQWHPLTPDEELVGIGADLARSADLLDAYSATALHDKLVELAGGRTVAEAVIAGWLDGFKKKDPPHSRPDNFDNKRLHPSIEAAFAEAERRQNPVPTLLDATLRIGTSPNWESVNSQALRDATPASYAATIKALAGSNLRDFLRSSIVLYSRREGYATDFADALTHFASACRLICRENTIPRLSLAIRRVFRESGLEYVLDEAGAEGPPAAEPAEQLADGAGSGA